MGREFDDGEGNFKKESKGPHPEAGRNIEFYEKMRKKCVFSEEMMIGMSEMTYAGELIGMQFAYGLIGYRDGCFVLSFHQGNKEFKEELCSILNFFFSRRLLEKIEEKKPYNDKYEELFGRH